MVLGISTMTTMRRRDAFACEDLERSNADAGGLEGGREGHLSNLKSNGRVCSSKRPRHSEVQNCSASARHPSPHIHAHISQCRLFPMISPFFFQQLRITSLQLLIALPCLTPFLSFVSSIFHHFLFNLITRNIWFVYSFHLSKLPASIVHQSHPAFVPGLLVLCGGGTTAFVCHSHA